MNIHASSSKRHKAMATISDFVHHNIQDSFGALHHILISWSEEDALLSKHYDSPLTAVRITIERIIGTPDSLFEFVRQVDVRYSQDHHEKPIFQKPGDAEHPDDEYTHQSVEALLNKALSQL